MDPVQYLAFGVAVLRRISSYKALSPRAMITLSMPLGCAVSTVQGPCMPIPHKGKPDATQLLTWHHAADRLIDSHYSALPPGR
jgi:hypothetical protein